MMKPATLSNQNKLSSMTSKSSPLLCLAFLCLCLAPVSFSKGIPISTTKNTDGDVIDCFRLREQPAFDLQLLKDHIIQENPTEMLKVVRKDERRSESHAWRSLSGTLCPEGSVPIRRDLSNSTRSSLKKHPRLPKVTANVSGPIEVHEYAIASAPNQTKIYGAKATINVWEPVVQEGVNEFSLSQIWIVSGRYNSTDLNTIEAGLQVYPTIFGDKKPRLFTFWTNDSYQTGCYSVRCPGFIQISRNVALDTAISPISSFGSSQFEFTIFIWKDMKSGNWWMGIGPDVELVGYWPGELFTTLADHADEVQWGGEIVNTHHSGRHTTTQMGSGHFAEEGYGKASYVRNLEVVDSHSTLRPLDVLEVDARQPQYYSIKESYNKEWGVHFFYGGPGFNPRRSASERLTLDFFFSFLCFCLLIV